MQQTLLIPLNGQQLIEVRVDPKGRSHPISQYGESSRRDVQQNRCGGNELYSSNPHSSDCEMDEDATAGSIAHVMSPKRCAFVYSSATAVEYFAWWSWYREGCAFHLEFV